MLVCNMFKDIIRRQMIKEIASTHDANILVILMVCDTMELYFMSTHFLFTINALHFLKAVVDLLHVVTKGRL